MRASVSPKRSAHAVTCPPPPRLWRSWVGQGEPNGRAGQGGLDLVLDGPGAHDGKRDGSRPQERTAGDQRRGQGSGHQRCRPAHVEARHAHARGRRAATYRLGATRTLLRRLTGGVYGHPPRRVCPPPSNGSQEQWAGEKRVVKNLVTDLVTGHTCHDVGSGGQDLNLRLPGYEQGEPCLRQPDPSPPSPFIVLATPSTSRPSPSRPLRPVSSWSRIWSRMLTLPGSGHRWAGTSGRTSRGHLVTDGSRILTNRYRAQVVEICQEAWQERV
jgi:hypothetical protein